MPYKAKRACGYPGCPRTTNGRYCEEHERLMNRQYEQTKRDPATAKRRYASVISPRTRCAKNVSNTGLQ